MLFFWSADGLATPGTDDDAMLVDEVYAAARRRQEEAPAGGGTPGLGPASARGDGGEHYPRS